MKNPRFEACAIAANRSLSKKNLKKPRLASRDFASHVFHTGIMKEAFPKEVFANIQQATVGEEKLNPDFADTIAKGIKDWAVSLGATHYSHWFQPLTGSTAEKHEAFFDWVSPTEVVEGFSGSQLIQGEPDASSFPSGGLRSTYEARGVTGWDPSSFPFIWHAGDGITLFIPSVFFSYDGSALDTKIPLLRSDEKIHVAAKRLLDFTGVKANRIQSTIGLEQEYFVVDRALRNCRPDLVLAGRTLFGAPAAKGQELQDHYFGTVKDRMLAYMEDFEEAAIRLGIPVKTRHNEVAPSQYEVAPAFERASVACDHNLLLMELMRQMAIKHDLACLFHEKPFAGLNGSGKHCNWSLATDTGMNLLDPSETPQNALHFIILLTAILEAVHTHAKLIRASIGSAGNDHRLGGHEAPPAVLSVYLGHDLERLLDAFVSGVEVLKEKAGHYDLGLSAFPDVKRDTTDRNRTSPFAFTGNKFEMRALGSQANPAFFATVMNVIVADQLEKLLDAMESAPALEVIRESLKRSEAIRFSGDNYSDDWYAIAKRRGLPNITNSFEAFSALDSELTVKVFEGVLSQKELQSRREILQETFTHTVQIEKELKEEIVQTIVLPSAVRYLADLKKVSIPALEPLKEELVELITKLQSGESIRVTVDRLEQLVDDRLWLLPKYRELLFVH